MNKCHTSLGNKNIILYIPVYHKLRIDRMLEMTPDDTTNAGEHITSIVTNACSQRYTKDSVF